MESSVALGIDMDGYQVARQLRQELGMAVRIAAMTGFELPDSSRYLAAGFDQLFVLAGLPVSVDVAVANVSAIAAGQDEESWRKAFEVGAAPNAMPTGPAPWTTTVP